MQLTIMYVNMLLVLYSRESIFYPFTKMEGEKQAAESYSVIEDFLATNHGNTRYLR